MKKLILVFIMLTTGWLLSAKTKIHDNELNFTCQGNVNYVTFDWYGWNDNGYSITDGQPFDGVSSQDNYINVKAGRHKSKGPKDWFMKELSSEKVTRTLGGFDSTPGELNFAIKGTLNIFFNDNEKVSIPNVVIGQGYSGGNNWWIGVPISRKMGEDLKISGGNKRGVKIYWNSDDGNYTFRITDDVDRCPIWAANPPRENGSGPFKCTYSNPDPSKRLQSDGSLMIYNGNNYPIWGTNTGGDPGHPNARIVMQDDGNLVIYDNENPVRQMIWHTNTTGDSGLQWVNGDLQMGLGWHSNTAGRGARWAQQSDGNLVVYDADGNPIWASGTDGHPGACFEVHGGDLQIWWDNPAIWASGTDGWDGATCVFQEDGNLVIYW